MKTVVAKDSSVYYKEKYWNDFPEVLEYINRKVSGDPKKWIIPYFKEKYASKPFKNALFINCGNGWVERDFINLKIVKKATAFDYSKDLLEQAKKLRGKMPIKYIQADVNKIGFKKNEFDLVVNFAALHHVQYINRLCVMIAKSLKSEGVFFNYDYVGPHRNQYPFSLWRKIKKVNDNLPLKYRKNPLNYPHVATMLIDDPTEAIHSELILQKLEYYFNSTERKDIGGGIAYTILSSNKGLSKKPNSQIINKVINIDDELTIKGQIPALFSFIVCSSKKNIFKNKPEIIKLQREENLREKYSYSIENTYRLVDYLWVIASGRRDFKLTIKRFIRLFKYLFVKIFLSLNLISDF